MFNRFRIAVRRESRKRTANVESSNVGAKSLKSFKVRRGPGENNITRISRKVSINGNTVRKRVLRRTERNDVRKVSIYAIKLFSKVNVFPIGGNTEIIKMVSKMGNFIRRNILTKRGCLDTSEERLIGGILASKYVAFRMGKLMSRVVGRKGEEITEFRKTTHNPYVGESEKRVKLNNRKGRIKFCKMLKEQK
jgi:hypothetical protein